MAQSIEKNKLIANIKKFIKKLQRSDDKTKKRWLIVSSAVSMLIIFFLWLTYLNLVVMPKTEIEKTATTTIIIKNSEKNRSFFKTFFIGLKIMAENLKNQFTDIRESFNETYDNFKDQIQKKNEFILEKGDTIQNTENQ